MYFEFDSLVPTLAVTLAGNYTASGPQNGPFTGSPTSYTVQNSGGGTLNWTATGPSWLTLSPATSGSLGASATATVNVSVNTADPAAQTAGTYSGNITFTNTATSATVTRTATLTVNDVIAPTITGTPGSVSLNTPSNSATATHTWSPPTATDNTGGTGVGQFTVTLSGAAVHGPVAAASLTTFNFPIGVTTVTYQARDNATPTPNNATPTSFTVTVTDNVAPVFSTCPASQTLQATGPGGASASWPLPAASDNSGSVVVTQTAGLASGSTFPVGVNVVTFTATDPYANATPCTFNITVQDTTPPVFSGVPANVTLEATSPAGAQYPAYTALPVATDIVGGNRPVTASHPVGTTFPFTAPGPTTTTVTFSASDAAVPPNTATAQFTVTVRDTTPPNITSVPSSVTAEATSPAGAAVTFGVAAATDVADPAPVITYSHASGSTFPLGTTTVTVTARDASNNQSTATFTVTVQDTTAPTFPFVPGNLTANLPANSATAIVSWPTPAPFATDAVGVTSSGSSHASGSAFPVGVTTVTYTAQDAAGNVRTASFTVTVVDGIAPVFSGVPANIIAEATGPGGANVSFLAPTATDAVDGARPVTSSHGPNTLFPLGTTTVTFTAQDLATPPNVASASFQVTVRDTTPPLLGAVSNVTVTAPDLSGAIVSFPLPTAIDIVDATPTVTASPASGSLFPIGMTTVTVTAVDDYANAATRTFTVTVLSPAQMAVTPATGLTSTGPQGQQGAPFSPTSQAYVVSNGGQVPMDFTVSGANAWVSATPAGGTLPPGGSVTVTVALTAGADALGVGVHNATFGFTNTTSNIGNTTRAAQLTVLAPANMAVTPATAFNSAGPQGQQGGAFTPLSTTYTVQNTGALAMDFTVTGAPSWVTLSAVGGTLAPGASQVITASLNAGANALPVGAQNGTLTFTNATNGIGNTPRTVTLNVQEPARLTVTPPDGLVSSGFQGGPFSPPTKTYTLSNTGAFPLNFTAADNQGWLDAAPPSGTIPPGGSTTVTLSLNAAANALASGTHNGMLTLTNTTSGLGNTTRPATLTAIPNGQVVLKVASSLGDGTYTFSSATPALSLPVTTSGGVGQSAAITLNPATYAVSVKAPDGFGLTGITCSDNDSTGNVPARSASIVLASAETVTCTFNFVNSRKKTVEVIGQFMSRRNDMLLSNGPDPNRQVDRLIDAGGQSPGGGSNPGVGNLAGFSNGTGSAGVAGGPGRLGGGGIASAPPGFGGSAAGIAAGYAGGNTATGTGRSGPFGQRSFEDRIAELRGPEMLPSDRPAGPSPFNLSGGTEGSTRMSFGTSLAQAMRYAADSHNQRVKATLGPDAMALGLGNAAVKRATSPFDVWVEGTYLSFNDNRIDATRRDGDGHFGVLYAGADYVFNRYLLIGALVQFDSMRQKSVSQSYDIHGKGWMAGPYATIRLSENLFLQGRAAWGRSTNEISPFLTYTDQFSSNRWLASTTLVGRWQFGDWQFRPSATVSYIEDVSEAYTDSLGVGIPSVKASLGQLKAGPQVSYRTMLGGIIVEPRAGIEAIWNFSSSAKGVDFGGTLAGPEELRGRVELGVRAQMPGGTSLDVSGSYDGIGSTTYSAIGGKATVRVPLN